MKRTIMIVDDNERNVDIISRLLKSDYALLTAGSGEAALDLAVERRPDIVLLDIMMPGIDGYETCRRMRANPELANVKIIMVSAKALASERIEGYAAGADDYVTKPFDLDEFEAKIKVYARLSGEEQTRQTVAELLKNLSESIGTPLGYLQDAADLLDGEPSLEGRARELMQIVSQSATAIRIADDKIRLLSSLELGERRPSLVPADPAALLERAVARIEWLKIRTGCLVATRHEGRKIAVVDEAMMVDALASILEIALRHSVRCGRVHCLVSVDEEFVVEIGVDAVMPNEGNAGGSDHAILRRIVQLVTALHGGAADLGAAEHGALRMKLTIPSRVESGAPSTEQAAPEAEPMGVIR